MFLARIEGTVVAAAKHPTLEGCRFLVARRLEADGTAAAEPNVVVDWMGAARGATVMVSTDGDIAREKLGNNTPARMVVVGLVDAVQQPANAQGAQHETRHRSRTHHAHAGGGVVHVADAGDCGAGDDGESAREKRTGRRQGADRGRRTGRGDGPDGGVHRGTRGGESVLAQRRCRWMRICR